MNRILGMITTLITACFLTGCGTSDAPNDSLSDEVTSRTPDGVPSNWDEHDHGALGAHGGELIEIGKASFHGELLHTTSEVTIYILGPKAKESVSIDATELTISLKHDGSVQSYTLMANPQSEDAAGKSSRFDLKDSKVAAALNDGAEGVVIFQVDGKSHTGSISHDHEHEHEGHEH